MTPDDEDVVVWTWIYSYARSAYGIARGAHVPSMIPGQSRPPKREDMTSFWSEQRPIVVHLLACADVAIACDAQAPDVVWGWACTSGDTVHYVLAKRTAHQAGVSADIYRDLLGDRMQRACGMTHELVDMRRSELRAAGVTLPREWYLDTTWFARQRQAA